MTKDHSKDKGKRRINIPARGIAQFELARAIAEQLGLSWGHGIRPLETDLEPGLVETKIRVAGKGNGSVPAIIHATFKKMDCREWVPTGLVTVISTGVIYTAICIEDKTGTLMTPLEEIGVCE